MEYEHPHISENKQFSTLINHIHMHIKTTFIIFRYSSGVDSKQRKNQENNLKFQETNQKFVNSLSRKVQMMNHKSFHPNIVDVRLVWRHNCLCDVISVYVRLVWNHKCLCDVIIVNRTFYMGVRFFHTFLWSWPYFVDLLLSY